MLTLGSLAFTAPWVLVALAAIPALWWLIRVTPPSPKRLRFPAIRLLYDLVPREETPARTPWWLLLLRLVAAALVILGLAHPLIAPSLRLAGPGPLVLLVDDGWAAGRHWDGVREALASYIDLAERDERPVVALSTAVAARPVEAGLTTAREARAWADALEPKPWATDRDAAVDRLEALAARTTRLGSAQAVWISDGLAGGDDAAIAERLQHLGSLTLLEPQAARLPRLVEAPERVSGQLVARVRRADATGPATVAVNALAEDGRTLAREEIALADGADSGETAFELPLELANGVTRIVVEGEPTAGAVALLDARWQRRRVGLLAPSEYARGQPLLDELFYLERALSPSSEVVIDGAAALLDRDISLLVMADASLLEPGMHDAVAHWVEAGGTLLRFAGPTLAAADAPDDLLPVALRRGDRALGGALSWTEPARLAPFPEDGPFAGLQVSNEVRVRRQVLAQPSLDLADRTWARLADGTPLVTAAPRGEGRVILVHTTANTSWSDLALSGLFVEMLERIVALARGGNAAGTDPLPPIATLDGFGRLGTPSAGAVALDPARPVPGPETPPGYYGGERGRVALNLAPSVETLAPLPPLPAGVERRGYGLGRAIDLTAALIAAALVLLLADLLISLWLRGLLPFLPGADRGDASPPPGRRPGRRAGLTRASGAAGAVLLAALIGAVPGGARADDSFALDATLETRLAYVRTGVAEVDALSQAGLTGLADTLSRRTAVEVGAPMGVDLDTDELAFFPLLYWPIDARHPPLSQQAIANVNRYLRNGGSILFDTRDQGEIGPSGVGSGTQRLQALTAGIELPPLEPVPPDHVLTKAFYLMQEFPGRWSGGTVWVEHSESGDEVASVIVGGNDWAGAWAVDSAGRPLRPVVPGGERQRELARRFGVNVVMYALTGNYKADQVHVPSILERLGQ